jgi:glycosyltransferase involved in cell wall biosynthesis
MSDSQARIAVITPYCGESIEVLRQCHDSVLAQEQHGVQADHFLVADGRANKAVDGWQAHHIVLPHAHADNGNTPRAVGSVVAETEGYEFIAYLDADNWFHPEHLRSLLDLREATKVPVTCAWRTFHRLDGMVMEISEADENSFQHVDTSCYLIHRSAFACTSCWYRMPKPLSPLCDRIFFRALKNSRWGMAFTGRRTVAFRSQYENHYRAIGQEPPPNAKTDRDLAPCVEYLRSVSGINETVEKLGFWPSS